ncbi:MAG: HNH endonuclease [Bdellovibrionia bacterium]
MQSSKQPLHNHIFPKSLSNEALLRNTQTLVAEERKLTTAILWHLQEIQVRRLYAEKGFGSLFEYAVQALGYSEAAAGRRIAAMRLLVNVPEIEPALQNGQVSISTLSTIQSYIQRKEAPVSRAEKIELVMSLQGKSRRECEKHLVTLDPAAATLKEKERVISPSYTEIRFVADDELMQKLQKIKELDGHFHSHPSYLELLHRMADLALKKLDPQSTMKQTQSASPSSLLTPPAELNPSLNQVQKSKPALIQNKRYIRAELKRQVWKRDQGRCHFKSPDGRLCGSRFALEIDHIHPVAWNGQSELSNIQLLCRTHNRFKALAQLGPQVMEKHLRTR